MVNTNQDIIIEGLGLEKLGETANDLIKLSGACRVWLIDGVVRSQCFVISIYPDLHWLL